MIPFTYYGHSCFSLNVQGKTLLFDPFISPNPLAAGISLDSLTADYILISHGHEDHIADAVQLLQQTGAMGICAWEVYVWLTKQGLNNLHPMNTGGQKTFEGFTVKCVAAQHSSSLPDGTYGGNPMGFVITSPHGNVYYSGDTALTLDMKLIGEQFRLNAAILPIGDNFTMGAADAAIAADFVQCNNVIGVHYDTFGFIKIDHATAQKTFQKAGKKLTLIPIGETIVIPK